MLGVLGVLVLLGALGVPVLGVLQRALSHPLTSPMAALCRYLKTLPKSEGKPWNELVPTLTSEEGRDLLSKMLVFNPKKVCAARVSWSSRLLAGTRNLGSRVCTSEAASPLSRPWQCGGSRRSLHCPHAIPGRAIPPPPPP